MYSVYVKKKFFCYKISKSTKQNVQKTMCTTKESILQSIFRIQVDWVDVSVAVIVVVGVGHHPQQEAAERFVERVVSLRSSSPSPL